MIAARDRVAAGFAQSMAFHGLLVGALIGWQFYSARTREQWGDPNSVAGGSVAITAVARIPIPTRPGPVNPVANDTESELPTPPKQAKPQPQPVDDRDAIAIKSKREPKRITDIAASRQRYRPETVDRENQIYSNTGQRAVSPMFGVEGSGGVGTGTGSPFGARFGWYEALLRQRVAQKWRTQDIDARIRQLPVAIATFTIHRDGTIRNVRVVQSSGNYVLDTSAQRAINDAAPFPPLPPQFERDSASIEFWFELKR